MEDKKLNALRTGVAQFLKFDKELREKKKEEEKRDKYWRSAKLLASWDEVRQDKMRK